MAEQEMAKKNPGKCGKTVKDGKTGNDGKTGREVQGMDGKRKVSRKTGRDGKLESIFS
jgi:hypothetical protein